MKFGSKLFIVLIVGLFVQSIACAELLGRISDETAKLPEQTPTVDETKSKIIYRVICSPEADDSPECGQQPVEDYLDPTSRKASIVETKDDSKSSEAQVKIDEEKPLHHASAKVKTSAKAKKKSKQGKHHHHKRKKHRK
jgi:hypothetical protein